MIRRCFGIALARFSQSLRIHCDEKNTLCG